MNIIGINAFHGDSAACLFVDGKMISAAEEERFRRIKHWAGFPSQAIQFCMEKGGLNLDEIDFVAINSDPAAAKFKKVKFLLSGQASWPLVKEKLLVRKQRQSVADLLNESFPGSSFKGSVEYVEHHQAHLASAYNVSPFDAASVVSIDGFGDFASAAWGYGEGGNIDIQKRVYFPHSMGIFYQALTQYLGFPHYGDEYKVMGLAPYGEPKYRDQMDQIVAQNDDGTFELNLDYFTHHQKAIGYEWENGIPKVGELFDQKLASLLGSVRKPEEELTQHHFDIARSIQDAYERTFFNLLNHVQKEHDCESLTIAGGCGMNSVANGKVHLKTPYKDIYVQSAAGDAGGAIGAAVVAGQRHGVSDVSTMVHSYWGNEFSQSDYQDLLDSSSKELADANCDIKISVADSELYNLTSDYIIEGKVIGWFQGAMEWGPRALGNRSILGDPRRQDMKDILNLKIKRRESFRPFAPSVLREHVSEWFESDANVPFMMKVFQIQEQQRDKVPAITHVDGSGRLQTVSMETNAKYYQLIKAFYEKTNVPMLLNTSFNENEPVVRTPDEALACFLRTNMDVLVLGSNIITRPVAQ